MPQVTTPLFKRYIRGYLQPRRGSEATVIAAVEQIVADGGTVSYRRTGDYPIYDGITLPAGKFLSSYGLDHESSNSYNIGMIWPINDSE